MKRGINSDKRRYLRCLLLSCILGFSPFEITPTAAFQIVRQLPDDHGVGNDLYDKGIFVYKNHIVDTVTGCYNMRGQKCGCSWGNTFVFHISGNGSIKWNCFEKFFHVFGCYFHFGMNYVMAVKIPDSSRSSSIGAVEYSYSSLRSISSIEHISYWNMTWHSAPANLFTYKNDDLEWGSTRDQQSKYGGLLLKIDMVAYTANRSPTVSGCLLLKIAGTRTYPLTPYRSQVTSHKVTPTTSMVSTQIQSSIPHVSSTTTALQRLTATSSFSSLFDYRATSVSSERFKIDSLTSSISSVVASLSALDTSITSVLSTIHRSHTNSESIKSIANSSQTVIHSSWIMQSSNVQPSKPTPRNTKGVMQSTSDFKVSSEYLHPLDKSASFQLTKDFVSISSTILSSVIQNGNTRDTSEQSGDNIPVIVGSLLGSLFGVVAIIMVTLLCRRKFFGKENITKQDKLQLQLPGDSYNKNGSISGSALRKIDNPAYGESIDLSICTSIGNGSSMHVYESATDGICNGNQIPEQVYSEVDENQEPIYREVENDEPIYKEVIEEGPISEEKDAGYQPLDETMVKNPGTYEGLYFQSDSSRPQSPIYQIVEAENGQSN